MSPLEKEFVPYELALRMKEFGFDEECFGSYYLYKDENHQEGKFDYRGELNIEFSIYTNNKYYILAPTFSQAFRFFREKYGLHSCIHSDYTWNISGGIWDLNEYKGSRYDWDYSNNYLTYEEAELSCLKKLIEIVEKNWLKQHN